MNVLIIGSRVPWPLKDGGAIATFSMLEELSKQGMKVTYFTFNTRKHYVSKTYLKEKLHFCEVLPVYLDTELNVFDALKCLLINTNYNINRFYSKPAELELKKLLQEREFDVIQFEGLFSTPLLKTVQQNSNCTLVYRAHNVEWKIWANNANQAKGLKRLYLKQLAQTLKTYEVKVIKYFRNIISISRIDLEYFQELNLNARYYNYPTGIAVEKDDFLLDKNFSSALPTKLFHIGSMEWLPNRQGLEWFVKEVWPLVLKKNNNIWFSIAGKSLKKNDSKLSGKNIINYGEVEDAHEFMFKNEVCIVPLFSGSGIRIKSLEAMSLGIPVISTSIGAAGIDYQRNVNILIADNAEDFAAAIVKITTDLDVFNKISVNAKNLIQLKYNLELNTSYLIAFYYTIKKIHI